MPGSSKRLRWLDTVSSPLCCGIDVDVVCDDESNDEDDSIDGGCCDDDSIDDDDCC